MLSTNNLCLKEHISTKPSYWCEPENDMVSHSEYEDDFYNWVVPLQMTTRLTSTFTKSAHIWHGGCFCPKNKESKVWWHLVHPRARGTPLFFWDFWKTSFLKCILLREKFTKSELLGMHIWRFFDVESNGVLKIYVQCCQIWKFCALSFKMHF